MEIMVGTIFIVVLLLVVYAAVQPGLENLRLAGQRQELETGKLNEIQIAGLAAQTQIDEIMVRYGQMVDEVLKGDTLNQRDSLDVLIFSENDFSTL